MRRPGDGPGVFRRSYEEHYELWPESFASPDNRGNDGAAGYAQEPVRHPPVDNSCEEGHSCAVALRRRLRARRARALRGAELLGPGVSGAGGLLRVL